MMQCLLQSGRCDCNLTDRRKCTPLHVACEEMNIRGVEILVADERCDLNIPRSNGDTPLHIATCSKSESAQMMQCLLQSGRCDCNLTDRRKCTPLHVACEEMNIRGVEVLVADGGCDLNIPDGNGDTALHIAACSRSNNIEMVQVMLRSGRCDLNVTNKQHYTPIHVACKNGIVPLVELVRKNGGNILQTSSNDFQDGPIHIACKHYSYCMQTLSTDSFALLSYKECDPNQQNARGDTALHIVCKMTDSKMPYFEALISTPGINLKIANHEGLFPFEVVDSNGDTLIHTACSEGNSAMVEFLLKNGVDILKPNRVGDAPIHIACNNCKLEVLTLLLGCRKCNPNQQNACGDTALHIVCKMGFSLILVKILMLIPGVNPGIVNHKGLTPIEEARNNYATIDAIKKFLVHKNSSIQGYLKIFVVGNSGTGKSTLIKAVTTEASQLLKYVPLSKM